jgi:hypothetical protein
MLHGRSPFFLCFAEKAENHLHAAHMLSRRIEMRIYAPSRLQLGAILTLVCGYQRKSLDGSEPAL